MENKMSKFIVYQTTNKINGKIYIGVHKHLKEDSYLGSGAALKKAIKKHGRKSFKRETLFEFDSKREAYKKEEELVTESFIARRDTYNMKPGGLGHGIFYMGLVNVRDSEGNTSRVSVDDPRVLSGELVPLTRGKGNPMYGKCHSKETIEKNRQAHLGKSLSDETKEKISKRLLGKSPVIWITPVGEFNSLQLATKETGIPAKNIARFCVEYRDKVISNRSYTSSEFLQSLGNRDEIVEKGCSLKRRKIPYWHIATSVV
jgi:group I intron endonuclease